MNKTIAILLALVLTASFIILNNNGFSSAVVGEDSWVSKTPLPTARMHLGIAVVDGKIYAIGGYTDLSNNDEYDPATDTWTTKAPMPTARYMFGIAVYNNKIYCFGGQSSNRSINARPEHTGVIEVYDPATNTWETKTPMPNPRSQFQANAVDGRIYLMGGRTGGQGTTVALNEVYDPETEAWTTKAPMPYPVVSYASAVVDKKIYVFGGQDEFNQTINLAVNQIYDTETDTWSFGASLPTVVWKSAAVATSGDLAPERIYVIGGQPRSSGGAANITQVYDPKGDNWSIGASMPTARFALALAVVNDTLYSMGGTSHNIFPGEDANAENEMYTPIGYRTDGDNIPESFPLVPIAIATVVAVGVVGAGLLLFLRRRKRSLPTA